MTSPRIITKGSDQKGYKTCFFIGRKRVATGSGKTRHDAHTMAKRMHESLIVAEGAGGFKYE